MLLNPFYISDPKLLLFAHNLSFFSINCGYFYFSESTLLNLDLFKNLDAEIGPQLSTLASEIGEQYTKTIAQYVLF